MERNAPAGVAYAMELVAVLPVPTHNRPAVHCPYCGELGSYVNSEAQKRAPHFRHTSTATCTQSALETALHLRAKRKLVEWLRAIREAGRALHAELLCHRSGSAHPLTFVPAGFWDEERVEADVLVPQPDGTAKLRKPDVALLRNGEVVFAFEIYVTHEVSSAKAKDYAQRNIPWMELNAEDLFNTDGAFSVDDGLPNPRNDGGLETGELPYLISEAMRVIDPLFSSAIRAAKGASTDPAAEKRVRHALAKRLQVPAIELPAHEAIASFVEDPEGFKAHHGGPRTLDWSACSGTAIRTLVREAKRTPAPTSPGARPKTSSARPAVQATLPGTEVDAYQQRALKQEAELVDALFARRVSIQMPPINKCDVPIHVHEALDLVARNGVSIVQTHRSGVTTDLISAFTRLVAEPRTPWFIVTARRKTKAFLQACIPSAAYRVVTVAEFRQRIQSRGQTARINVAFADSDRLDQKAVASVFAAAAHSGVECRRLVFLGDGRHAPGFNTSSILRQLVASNAFSQVRPTMNITPSIPVRQLTGSQRAIDNWWGMVRRFGGPKALDSGKLQFIVTRPSLARSLTPEMQTRQLAVGARVTCSKSFNGGDGLAFGEIGTIAAMNEDYIVLNLPGITTERVLPRSSEKHLCLASVITVEQARGSQFDHVAVLFDEADYDDPAIGREHIYTALSCARKSAFLVGTKEGVQAIRNRSAYPDEPTSLTKMLQQRDAVRRAEHGAGGAHPTRS